MREAGIRPLLLKGPSLVAWLYGDGSARPYQDSDLLVEGRTYQLAGRVLRRLGFSPRRGALDREAETWLRPGSNPVDLHRSLKDVPASPEAVWQALTEDTETLRIGGVDVEVLGPPGRALHVALHAAQHGTGGEWTVAPDDLERALRVADRRVEQAAADLARRLDALGAFAVGLRLHPAGARLAADLGLRESAPAAVALRTADVPLSLSLETLLGERSLIARARLIWRAAFPSPLVMRHWAALNMQGWPRSASGGRTGICVAYVWRPILLALRLPRAVAAVRRARRARSI